MASLVSVHLEGEGKDEVCLDTLSGKFTITRTAEALTPSSGLAAWRGFLKHLGILPPASSLTPNSRWLPNCW